ncbi:exported hypothetical protein [Verrucomicrobia bacterium]|nr:exported hypothetical protein [Verrucomicrobiota bacterium]
MKPPKLQRALAMLLPLLGERAGVRASVQPIVPMNRSRDATLVAQICNLPYRRFSICRAFESRRSRVLATPPFRSSSMKNAKCSMLNAQ